MSTNVVPMMVPRGDGSWTFPRRNCIDQLIPAERALRDAITTIDSLPGDVRLTEMVIRLTEEQNRLADWVEETGSVLPTSQDEPKG
jgi:hypothetical protein